MPELTDRFEREAAKLPPLSPPGFQSLIAKAQRRRRSHMAMVAAAITVGGLVLVSTSTLGRPPRATLAQTMPSASAQAELSPYPNARDGAELPEAVRQRLLDRADMFPVVTGSTVGQVYAVASHLLEAQRVTGGAESLNEADQAVWVIEAVGDFECLRCGGIRADVGPATPPAWRSWHYAYGMIARDNVPLSLASGGLGPHPHSLDRLGQVYRLR